MAPHAAASGGTPATPAGIDKGGSAGSSDARCTGRDPVAHSAVNGRKRLKRVAIIGGGSAGIVQAQQLHQLSHAADSEVAFETTIYERRPKLGAGLWMCDQETGECVIRWDEHGRGWPTSGPSEGTGEGEEDRRWPIGAMYEVSSRCTLRSTIATHLPSFALSRSKGPPYQHTLRPHELQRLPFSASRCIRCLPLAERGGGVLDSFCRRLRGERSTRRRYQAEHGGHQAASITRPSARRWTSRRWVYVADRKS